MGNPFSRLASGYSSSIAAAVTLVLVAVLLAAIVAAYVLPSTGNTAYASAPQAGASSASAVGGTSLSDPDILYAQVAEAQRRRDWPLCIGTLDRLISIQPDDSYALEQLYHAHLNLAWELTVDHHLEEAREQFTLALRVKRDSDEAQQGLRLLDQLVVPQGGAAPTATPVAPVCTPTPVRTARPEPSPTAVCQPTPVPPTCIPQPVAAASCISAPAPAVTYCCYTVQTGDTLFCLAQRFGTTVEAIMAANGLTCPTIRVCQQLLIPTCACVPTCVPVCPPVVVCQPIYVQPVCPTPCPTVCAVVPKVVLPAARSAATVHVVQRGEDIFRLAIRYNVSVILLMRVNGLETTTIRAGQVLLIPY